MLNRGSESNHSKLSINQCETVHNKEEMGTEIMDCPSWEEGGRRTTTIACGPY